MASQSLTARRIGAEEQVGGQVQVPAHFFRRSRSSEEWLFFLANLDLTDQAFATHLHKKHGTKG